MFAHFLRCIPILWHAMETKEVSDMGICFLMRRKIKEHLLEQIYGEGIHLMGKWIVGRSLSCYLFYNLPECGRNAR